MPVPFDELARLRDQEHLSYSEIARRLGISVAAVSARFKRAGRSPLIEFKHEMSWTAFVAWFFHQTERLDEHLIWTGRSHHQYGEIYYEGRGAGAHVWAWRIHHGRFPRPGHDIHHECEVKRCVDWRHLRELVRLEHQRIPNRGQFAETGVSTDELQRLRADGLTVRQIAEQTGMRPDTIYMRFSRQRRVR